MITADRMLRVNRLSELKSDAIYVFDASNFQRKIILTKGELIGNTPRILHNSGWEDKVEEIAKMDTLDFLHEEGLRLIKKRNI